MAFTFDLSKITDQGTLVIKHSPHILRNELLDGGLHCGRRTNAEPPLGLVASRK